MTPLRVAVLAARGRTGRAVGRALVARGMAPVPVGRAELAGLPGHVRGCAAAYLIAPNLHPDEPAYVASALAGLREAGVGRVVYHSVASPYAPAMPHHVGKAVAEDLVRRSGLAWTILQPGAYLANLDLTGDVEVPYSTDAVFGFADLDEVADAAAVVLTEAGHVGATYELASRVATVAHLAEAGVGARRVRFDGSGLPEREAAWLAAMFAYYDDHGLPVGTRVLDRLLGRG